MLERRVLCSACIGRGIICFIPSFFCFCYCHDGGLSLGSETITVHSDINSGVVTIISKKTSISIIWFCILYTYLKLCITQIIRASNCRLAGI